MADAGSSARLAAPTSARLSDTKDLFFFFSSFFSTVPSLRGLRGRPESGFDVLRSRLR